MLQLECGFVGNVWVNQNWMAKAGDMVGGHVHDHDHVSLLTQGRVSVLVGDAPGAEPREFKAPTFIVIRKGLSHQITALEDNSVWYCIHAMRDLDGQVIDIYNPENDPLFPTTGTWDEERGKWVFSQQVQRLDATFFEAQGRSPKHEANDSAEPVQP